jgi:putative transposase
MTHQYVHTFLVISRKRYEQAGDEAKMDSSVQVYRARQWMEIIQQCAKSGMKKRDYCQAHGINEKTFYYWQRRLRDRMSSSLTNQLEAEPLPNPFVKLSGPMDSSESDGSRSVVFVSVGFIRIEIYDRVDEALLTKVLRAASRVG